MMKINLEKSGKFAQEY